MYGFSYQVEENSKIETRLRIEVCEEVDLLHIHEVCVVALHCAIKLQTQFIGSVPALEYGKENL